MEPTTRFAIVVTLLVAGAVITWWYRRRREADESQGVDDASGAALWPDLPLELGVTRGAGGRGAATWVIFSTPLCVSCSQVQADLERGFPHHRVLKIDATERPDLADLYAVRRAPTTIVADATGRIVERLVGPEAVRDFIGTAEDPALR